MLGTTCKLLPQPPCLLSRAARSALSQDEPSADASAWQQADIHEPGLSRAGIDITHAQCHGCAAALVCSHFGHQSMPAWQREAVHSLAMSSRRQHHQHEEQPHVRGPAHLHAGARAATASGSVCCMEHVMGGELSNASHMRAEPVLRMCSPPHRTVLHSQCNVCDGSLIDRRQTIM